MLKAVNLRSHLTYIDVKASVYFSAHLPQRKATMRLHSCDDAQGIPEWHAVTSNMPTNGSRRERIRTKARRDADETVSINMRLRLSRVGRQMTEAQPPSSRSESRHQRQMRAFPSPGCMREKRIKPVCVEHPPLSIEQKYQSTTHSETADGIVGINENPSLPSSGMERPWSQIMVTLLYASLA